MSHLKIISLNINEGMLFERQCALLESAKPDVVCLQETTAQLSQDFAAQLGMRCTYEPLWVRPAKDTGIALLSRMNPLKTSVIAYEQDNHDAKRGEVSRRRLIVAKFLIHGTPVNIATVHFIWSPDGNATDQQKAAVIPLLKAVSNKMNLVLTGDFNAPRGGEIFSMFSQEFIDNIPLSYDTSIDPDHHRNGGLMVMVDGLFTKQESALSVRNIELKRGVSDHCAVVADIELGLN